MAAVSVTDDMSKKHLLRVRYRFEKAPAKSEFQRIAVAAHQLVQSVPWAVPSLPFGTTSRVGGGLLEALPSNPSPARASTVSRRESLRLKAIELSDGTSLEHFYDTAGHLIKTLYPDNVCVRYLRDDTGRLVGVGLGEVMGITYRYCDNGLLDSVSFRDGSQFCYQYDSNGSLWRTIFPDHKSMSCRYNRRGRPDEVTLDNSRFTYGWDAGGALRRMQFQSVGRTHELTLASDRLQINLLAQRTSPDGETRLISPLGRWTYSADRRLVEMVVPDSEWLRLRQSADMNDLILISVLGQIVYQSDKAGILASILHANGTRSVFHRVLDTNEVYYVNPVSVTLYEYDRDGRLIKIRADDGQYMMFSYNRRGEVTRIASALGWLSLSYDSSGRMCEFKFSGGMAARVLHGNEGFPISLSLRGTAPDTLSSILTFIRTFWQWTAMKSSLRLEDTVLTEV